MKGDRVPGIDDAMRRARGEFIEMPGLRLTEQQAQRLWNLDPPVCSALLNALIDAKFLARTRDGAFMRADHATPARASLRGRSRTAA